MCMVKALVNALILLADLMARPTATSMVCTTRPIAKPGFGHKDEREMPCISMWKNTVSLCRNGRPLLKQGDLQETGSLLCSLQTSWHSSLKNPVVLLWDLNGKQIPFPKQASLFCRSSRTVRRGQLVDESFQVSDDRSCILTIHHF